MIRLKQILLGSVLAIVVLLFLSEFAFFTEIPNWIISAKIHFYIVTSAVFILVALIYIASAQPLVQIRLNLIDFALIFFSGYITIRYTTEFLFYNDRLISFLLSIFCFFFLKQILYEKKNGIRVAVSSLLVAASLEIFLGLLQLYGKAPSFHPGFAFTGTFHNPGPYAIYLSAIFLFAAGILLFDKESDKFSRIQRKACALICLFVLIILPATDSRTSWFVVVVLLMPMLLWKYNFVSKLTLIPRHRLRLYLLLTFVSLVLLASAMYSYKADSAYGRMVIWKISLSIVNDNFFWGIGYDQFQHLYGFYQIDFFSNNPESPAAGVADKSHYAFNDYLQLLVENGIVGLFLFILVLAAIFYYLRKPANNFDRPYLISAVVGLASILVGGLFSYPMQLLSIWWIFLFFLLIISVEVHQFTFIIKSIFVRLIIIVLAIALIAQVLKNQNKIVRAKRNWYYADNLAINGQHENAVRIYSSLFTTLSYDQDLLLAYGKSLLEVGRFEESIVVLEKARQRTADPFLFSNLGEAYSKIKRFDKAEQFYKMSIDMIPSRIYSRYLLVNMYLAKGDSVKASEAALKILRMEDKIASPAAEEIRHQMRSLLQLQE